MLRFARRPGEDARCSMDEFWNVIRQRALELRPFAGLPASLALPALPGVVTAFNERANDPGVTARELGGIIETDSGLTVEILRHVNSAMYHRRKPVSRVADAIMLLGLRQSKTFVIMAGAKAAMRAADARVINQEGFWNEALQRALFAREVAERNGMDVGTAFAGALLQDFLLPVLTREYPDAYLAFLRQARESPMGLCEFERQTFGWDHAQATAWVAHQWNLPAELVCCILYHHDVAAILANAELENSVCLPIALSAMLPGQLMQVVHGREKLVRLDQTASAYDLIDVCRSVDEQHAALANGCRILFPLTRQFEELAKRAATC